MALTVFPGSPKSCLKIWEPFTEKIVKAIIASNPNVIFVAWGRDAQSILKHIPDKVARLTSSHPSGRSAYQGFFGSNHFKLINQHLVNNNVTPIDWRL